MLCNASTNFYGLTNGESARSHSLAYRNIGHILETPVHLCDVKVTNTYYQGSSSIGYVPEVLACSKATSYCAAQWYFSWVHTEA